MTTISEPCWWEKTVEYAFVRNILPTLSCAFPLAGKAETAFGDLLMSDGAEFRLIEFKARKTNIQDEKRKWGFTKENCANNYKEPFHALLRRYYHEVVPMPHGSTAHWFIYGSPFGSSFKLEAHSYWTEIFSAKSLETYAHLQELTTVKHDDMLTYLDFLEQARGSASSGDSSLVIVGVAGGATLAQTIEAFRHASSGYKDEWQATEKIHSNPSSRPRGQ